MFNIEAGLRITLTTFDAVLIAEPRNPPTPPRQVPRRLIIGAAALTKRPTEVLSNHYLAALNFCPIHVSLKNAFDVSYIMLPTALMPFPIKVSFIT
jgi:hypothetical protein